jgi:hypothetical protein
MPMRGEAEHSLSYMFLHPRNARKKFPTILIRNPYGRLTFFYFVYLFASAGYNVICQDVRGRGESTGVFDCITDYEDGQATLEWISSQVCQGSSCWPSCPGRWTQQLPGLWAAVVLSRTRRGASRAKLQRLRRLVYVQAGARASGCPCRHPCQHHLPAVDHQLSRWALAPRARDPLVRISVDFDP